MLAIYKTAQLHRLLHQIKRILLVQVFIVQYYCYFRELQTYICSMLIFIYSFKNIRGVYTYISMY
jgi:hypothetical protein